MSYLQNSIAPKWNIYFSFVLKGRLRFTRVPIKPFTNIRAVSRGHHFDLMAAAMAKIVKNSQDVPGLVLWLWLVETTKVLEEAAVAAQAAGAGAVAVAVE